MTHFDSLAETIRQDHAPDTGCTLKMPYEVGRLIRGQFDNVLAYGRSLGLVVEDFEGGSGLLERRGYLRIQGRWGNARRLLLRLEELQ